MGRRLRFATLIAAVLAAAAMVVGCSSSSSTPSATGSAGGSGSAITVGVECSCTGTFGSTLGEAWSVVQAWAKSVNASGGLNGHPVTLVYKDNGSVTGTALTDANSLISDKVDAIIDLDILDAIWEKPASAAKIPVLGGNFSSEPYFTDADWYPSGQTNDSITYSVVATAKQAGATSLADFYCAESVQCQQGVPLIKAAGQSVGVPVTYSASIAATAPNYTAQCVAAKQAGVKAIFIGDSISVIARVASDCSQQNYNPVYVTEGTGFTNQALTAPGLDQSLWSSYPILPYFSTSSAVAAMNAAVNKYEPGTIQNTNLWSEVAAQAWTGGLLLQQAVKGAGVTASSTVTAATITGGLDKLSGETLGGFSPPLTFSAGQIHKVDCWYVGRVTGGKAEQVGGLTCHNS
jgi:branched-chain amino acid transport system substrate-binding protein